MFMLQSLEYYSPMFDGIMLSGDDFIAHDLILIKPENSDIVSGDVSVCVPHLLAATAHF